MVLQVEHMSLSRLLVWFGGVRAAEDLWRFRLLEADRCQPVRLLHVAGA